MIRRQFFAAVLGIAALSAVALPAAAREPVPFTRAAFEQAQAAGKPILVDIYAPWCPVCRAQEPTIDAVSAQPANSDLIVFRVDFDNQKSEVRSFRAQRQSTLIAYRGTTEVGRSVGDTNRASITALINATQR